MYLFFLPLIVLLLAAVYFDLTTQRIPNRLTLPGTLLGIVFFIPWFGINSALEHILGSIIVGGVWLVFWRTGIMGGGDQKLMTMVGAWLGYTLAVPVLFAVAVCGGIQALIWTFFQRSKQPAVPWRQLLKQTHLPYSLAITTGALVVIVSMWRESGWLELFNF